MGLPLLKGYNTICIFLDCLTKQRYLLPSTMTITVQELGKHFSDRVFHYHGQPETIMLERGLQFPSRFWKHLYSYRKIDLYLSTALYLQTDSQTERMNAVMEQHL